jgi:hypothetical protein
MPYRALGLIVSIAALALFSLPKPAHADDPQSHCAKVGNDDTVRTIPPNLIAGAATLFHEPANEAASHRDMYVYRCMGGSVWVCNHGANIPCAKGDTRRVLPSVTDYCNENPNQDFVPMVVTGHGTIHSGNAWGAGRASNNRKKSIAVVSSQISGSSFNDGKGNSRQHNRRFSFCPADFNGTDHGKPLAPARRRGQCGIRH